MPMCSCLSTTWSTPTTLFSSSRYQRLINAFLKHFCAVRATSLSAEDALLYKALTYLAVFRLDELKWSEFRRLCSSQVPVKVLPFIQALFLEELIISYSKEDWLKLYDGVFVNDLLRGLRLFHQEAQAYAETLAEAVYEPDEDLRYIPPPTTVIPFNLSVSNYTHPVEVEPEPFIYRAKPAPVWDKGRTLEMKRVSQVFKLNRTLLREKYSDPRYQPFRLRTLERPTNLETVREEVETKRAKECEYIVPKSGPVPSMPEIEVKLTTAALLREHSRFQKIIDSDKQKLQNLERELRDDSHMKAYENEMRIQQEIEHCMDVEFKKATVIASDQAARDSKKKHLCMNWAAASVTKEEKKRIHHEHAMLLKNIRFANRFRHHLIKEEEKVNKVKRNVIFNEKKNMVKKLNAESEDRLAVAALQRAREYQCKQELVRQLHVRFLSYQSRPHAMLLNFLPSVLSWFILLQRWVWQSSFWRRNHAIKFPSSTSIPREATGHCQRCRLRSCATAYASPSCSASKTSSASTVMSKTNSPPSAKSCTLPHEWCRTCGK
nr:cilia- and flagella-associated protein 99-like isoform X3 [Physcomitrium patens]|eukprot:XP_024400162.1 cilia- and flagella-associated protein 99-like isoform X3 [Physcomitrella patens]